MCCILCICRHYCKYDWTDTTDLYNFFKKIFTENGTSTKGCEYIYYCSFKEFKDLTRLYQLSYQIIDTFNNQTQNNKIIKTFIINNSKNYMLYVKDSQSHPSMLNFQP
jgi:hypothetical protein